MPPGSLCAVVVTFHPDAAVLENLTALREQVDVLIVVDNGSSADELCGLRRSFGRNLVELGRTGALLRR